MSSPMSNEVKPSEIARLTKENWTLKLRVADRKIDKQILKEEIEKMSEKIKELSDENKLLNKEKEDGEAAAVADEDICEQAMQMGMVWPDDYIYVDDHQEQVEKAIKELSDENELLKKEKEDLAVGYEELKEENEIIDKPYYWKFCGNDYEGGIEEMSEQIESLQEKNEGLKKHFNLMIDLIKGCDTDEKLQQLKELNKLE